MGKINWLRGVEYLIVALLGFTYILGGMSLVLLLLPASLLIYYYRPTSASRAELGYAAICAVYFGYFLWRVIANDTANETGGRTLWFVSENCIFLFALALLLVFRTVDLDRILNLMGSLLFPAILILLLAAFYEHEIMGVKRVTLGTISPLILAPLISVCVNLALADWGSRGRVWRIGAVLSWMIALYVILVYTGSRGALLAHLCGGGTFLLFLIHSEVRSPRANVLRIALAIMLLLFGAFLSLYIAANSDLVPRFKTIAQVLLYGEGEFGYSVTTRVLYHQLAWKNLWDAPWLGVGVQNTFAAIVADWPYDTNHGHLHSDQLNHLIGGGWIGWLIFNVMLLFPLIRALQLRVSKRTLYVVCTIVGLIMLNGLFARFFLRPTLNIYGFMALCFALAFVESERKRNSNGSI